MTRFMEFMGRALGSGVSGMVRVIFFGKLIILRNKLLFVSVYGYLAKIILKLSVSGYPIKFAIRAILIILVL